MDAADRATTSKSGFADPHVYVIALGLLADGKKLGTEFSRPDEIDPRGDPLRELGLERVL
ncbi:MAG: hypothetical protein JNM84_22625 [Planctomycetes bacterium]|nr:hypothetical protein [Planctomycetota bacterium]